MRRFAVCCVFVQLINIGFLSRIKTKVLARALLYKVPIVVLSRLFQKYFFSLRLGVITGAVTYLEFLLAQLWVCNLDDYLSIRSIVFLVRG